MAKRYILLFVPRRISSHPGIQCWQEQERRKRKRRKKERRRRRRRRRKKRNVVRIHGLDQNEIHLTEVIQCR